MTELAAPVDALEGTLRFAWSAAEVALLEVDVEVAQRVYDNAVGTEHGAYLDRRAARIVAAQARVDAATAYLDQAASFRAGQILRLEEEQVRVLRVAETTLEVERGIEGTLAVAHDSGVDLVADHATIEVLVDGGGDEIQAGTHAPPVLVPLAGAIDRVRLIGDQAGDAVVDVLRRAFGDPPSAGASITASAKPELDAAAHYDDSTLTGWSRELEANDVLDVVVEDASGIERLTLVLSVAL